jgi:hypothetical protein
MCEKTDQFGGCTGAQIDRTEIFTATTYPIGHPLAGAAVPEANILEGGTGWDRFSGTKDEMCAKIRFAEELMNSTFRATGGSSHPSGSSEPVVAYLWQLTNAMRAAIGEVAWCPCMEEFPDGD